MSVTAAQVQEVLTGFAEEFSVDVEALHNKAGYWIEHTTLSNALINSDPEWYAAIATYVNGKELDGE